MSKSPAIGFKPCARHGLVLACLFLFQIFPVCAHGQTPQRPPAPQFSLMQLRFSPLIPSARLSGLGGAFIGLANDATAIALNPAGASFITRPELSLNQAWFRSTRVFPANVLADQREARLHFYGTLINIVYPLKGFTFATYRQLAFRAAYDFERRQFLTISAPRPLTLHEQLGASGNFPGLRSEFSLEVWQDAFVAAKTLSPKIRLGASLLVFQLRLNLHEQHYFAPELWLAPAFQPGVIGANQASGLYRIYHATHDEVRAAWNAGVVVELNRQTTLGAIYHRLPRYRLDHRITIPAYHLADRAPNDGRDEALHFPAEERREPFELDLPDKFGVGLAWKPQARHLVTFDAVWHRSRTLLRGLEKNLPHDDGLDHAGRYVDPEGREDWASEEVLALHAGFEYLLLSAQTKMPVRLGCYRAAIFGVRALTPDANLQREYPADKNRWHLAGGLGLIIKSFRFEVSLDASSQEFITIGSAVVSL